MVPDGAKLAQWRGELLAFQRDFTTERLLWLLRMLALAVGLALCVYALLSIIYIVASSGGRSGEVDVADSSSSAGEGTERPNLDADTVKSWGWFSEPQAQSDALAQAALVEPQQEQDLSVTKLNLRLEGIAVAASPEASLAIIEINGESERYQIGAKLPAGRNVFLRAIMREAVHLENNGKLEELPLFTGELLEQGKFQPLEGLRPRLSVIDHTGNAQVVSTLGRYREQIQRNPLSVGKLMRFTLHREDGRVAGYQIGSVGNTKDFAQLGLQDGDVVTHVNGVDLTDQSQSMALYQQIGQLTELKLQLIREGQVQEILYRLPDSP